MARKKKLNKGARLFKKATKIAKKLLKKHPTWSWRHAVKEAFKELESGKKRRRGKK